MPSWAVREKVFVRTAQYHHITRWIDRTTSPVPSIQYQNEREVEEKAFPQAQTQAQKNESSFQVNDLTNAGLISYA
ncbi:hypothetical protein PM082_020418 [Marasmius tenuissimus]|nr:hypothetical protein PM082_020418 [Marasmius tenuissimus]